MDDQDEENYCHAIIEPLLDYPEKFTIDRMVDDLGIILRLNLAQPDMGKIIGRQGETARAIRLLLGHFGAKHRKRISMKLNEPTGSDFNVVI